MSLLGSVVGVVVAAVPDGWGTPMCPWRLIEGRELARARPTGVVGIGDVVADARNWPKRTGGWPTTLVSSRNWRPNCRKRGRPRPSTARLWPLPPRPYRRPAMPSERYGDACGSALGEALAVARGLHEATAADRSVDSLRQVLPELRRTVSGAALEARMKSEPDADRGNRRDRYLRSVGVVSLSLLPVSHWSAPIGLA